MARTLGATNKNKERLWKALRSEYGEAFDPILEMAKNSNRLQQDLDDMYEDGVRLVENEDGTKFMERIKLAEITNNAWDKVSAYVQPKLKAVEISGELEITAREMSDEEIAERLKELNSGND